MKTRRKGITRIGSVSEDKEEETQTDTSGSLPDEADENRDEDQVLDEVTGVMNTECTSDGEESSGVMQEGDATVQTTRYFSSRSSPRKGDSNITKTVSTCPTNDDDDSLIECDSSQESDSQCDELQSNKRKSDSFDSNMDPSKRAKISSEESVSELIDREYENQTVESSPSSRISRRELAGLGKIYEGNEIDVVAWATSRPRGRSCKKVSELPLPQKTANIKPTPAAQLTASDSALSADEDIATGTLKSVMAGVRVVSYTVDGSDIEEVRCPESPTSVCEVVQVSGSESEEESVSVPHPSSSLPTESKTSESSESPLVLLSMIATLEATMSGMKEHYEKQLRDKDDALHRIQNEVTWKDEQLQELNPLMEKNIEMEAKINFILSDPKAYEAEVKRVKEEKEKQDREREVKKRQEKDKQQKEQKESQQKEEKERQQKEEKEKQLKKERLKEHVKERRPQKEKHQEDEKQLKQQRQNEGDLQMIEDDEKTEVSCGDCEDGDDIDTYFLSNKGKQDDSDIEVVEVDSVAAKKGPSAEVCEDEGNKLGRHNIRKLITGSKLTEETKMAARHERERRDRVKKEHEKHIVKIETNTKTKLPVTTQLVLASKPDKTPLVEVNKKLIRKLKPHQVEAVQFLWDSVVESVDHVKAGDNGSGCILAHCMGLGKTLSVVTLAHTLLTSSATKHDFRTCLIVCPLNTVLNWQWEWEKWLDKRDRLPVYELASIKGHHERAEALRDWHENGGVMMMGYQLFRLLATYHGKSKRIKQTLEKSLINPGPDLVICDEGHILKNDASSISKNLNKLLCKRRIVLTGTPLQNNLIEYHCMVNFVKPNLLGTRREFGNRFVNPIVNGQHSDSTPADVKIMKRRAHVLHEMLDGCVQRRDYSALTKLLPPKNEYIISVRLSPIQQTLYEQYLSLHQPTVDGQEEPGPWSGGVNLFSDYQNLMRIWTHPWLLKMEQMRQEKKMTLTESDDDELESLIYISSSEEETELTGDDTASSISEPDESLEKKAASTPAVSTATASVAASSASSENGRQSRRSSKKRKTKRVASDSDQEGDDKEVEVSRNTRQAKRLTEECRSKDNDDESSKASEDSLADVACGRKAKVIAGEVIRMWKSSYRGRKGASDLEDDPYKRGLQEEEWWQQYVHEEHQSMIEASGKLVLLLEIIRMAHTLGDKVLVFSQSLLSLNLIEQFLALQEENKATNLPKDEGGVGLTSWVKDEDYCRIDGSTVVQQRKRLTTSFNDSKNHRLRLFLISTKAGGLGINLESANRVVVFDASWNPSHDIQSIFRVYRFGQEKNVFVYRFVAQGTMEEKIYERQVTKESLSQRVVDENQLGRHFAATDLQELYQFKPDRLDDPDREPRPTPPVPKDVLLAELLTQQKDWIVQYHEHDSLLENHPEEDLSEEERQVAWDEYEREKHGFYSTANTRVMGNNVYNERGEIVGSRPNPFNTSQVQVSTSSHYGAAAATNTSQAPVLMKMSQTGKSTGETEKTNSQMSQLPRVVQEILKYNPSISPEELQERLQAFLGMHGRFIESSSVHCVSTPPVQAGKTPVTTITLPPLPTLPSRLPRPGFVPAMKPN